jgi:predicted nucleic acid-binding protein
MPFARRRRELGMRLVLDSSVLVAAMKPAEPGHADARAFLVHLRAAVAAGAALAFAPPELWLEVLALLTKRMRGRRPFANATDLMYLWAAYRVEAAVVTLDEGLLKYHGVVCDVTRPQHVRLG